MIGKRLPPMCQRCGVNVRLPRSRHCATCADIVSPRGVRQPTYSAVEIRKMRERVAAREEARYASARRRHLEELNQEQT